MSDLSTGTSVPLPTPSLHPALPHSRLGAPGWAEPRAAGLAWGCSPGGPKPPAWRPVPTWPCSLPMPARCMYKTVGSPSTAAHPQHPWHPHSSPPAAPCSKAAVHSFKHGPIKVGQGERRKALPTPKPPPPPWLGVVEAPRDTWRVSAMPLWGKELCPKGEPRVVWGRTCEQPAPLI